jgi:hypothetical protein
LQQQSKPAQQRPDRRGYTHGRIVTSVIRP